jgi:hypothetical protein
VSEKKRLGRKKKPRRRNDFFSAPCPALSLSLSLFLSLSFFLPSSSSLSKKTRKPYLGGLASLGRERGLARLVLLGVDLWLLEEENGREGESERESA